MNLYHRPTVFLLAFLISTLAFSVKADTPYELPEFTQTSVHEWINSRPLTRKDLLGKVILIDFWTFGCWNCYRSFPWLHGLEKKYPANRFQIIGIHSPEFAHEKIHASIKAKIKEFKISHPVMVDNDMAYWRAMNNRYWPAYYLVDKKGRVRAHFVGETHKDSKQARDVEAYIAKLIAEK